MNPRVYDEVPRAKLDPDSRKLPCDLQQQRQGGEHERKRDCHGACRSLPYLAPIEQLEQRLSCLTGRSFMFFLSRSPTPPVATMARIGVDT